MRILVTNWFSRFIRRERISKESLRDAIERAERGLIDADLGNGLIKQRLSRPGQGHSGGFRTLIVFRRDLCSVFLYGFAKNQLDNISPAQLRSLRGIARKWLEADEERICIAIQNNDLQEVFHDREKRQSD